MYSLKKKMVHFQLISRRVDRKRYLRLARWSARPARSPRALRLAGPQSGREVSSESVGLGPERRWQVADGGGLVLAAAPLFGQHLPAGFPWFFGWRREPSTEDTDQETHLPACLTHPGTHKCSTELVWPCPFALPQTTPLSFL